MPKYYVSTGNPSPSGYIQSNFMRFIVDAPTPREACKKAWKHYINNYRIDIFKTDKFTFVDEAGFYINYLSTKYSTEFLINDVIE